MFSSDFWLRYFLPLYNMPMPLAIFPFMNLQSSSNVRCSSSNTPKNFVSDFISILMSSMSNSFSQWIFCRDFLNIMKWVFLRLRDNLLILSQSTTFTISAFIFITKSSWFLPVINMLESSANKSEYMTSDALARSLMYNRNNNGPSIDPCGTPHVIRCLEDNSSLYTTYCYLLLR